MRERWRISGFGSRNVSGSERMALAGRSDAVPNRKRVERGVGLFGGLPFLDRKKADVVTSAFGKSGLNSLREGGSILEATQ